MAQGVKEGEAEAREDDGPGAVAETEAAEEGEAVKKHHVQAILEAPLKYRWSVQGFGKLSTNITGNSRLHLWDRVLLDPRVPAVHSHSYDFRSVVLVGVVRNLRMVEVEGDGWNRVLVTSVGEIVEAQTPTMLHETPMEVHGEGAIYEQQSGEVHWSAPDDGTATLVEWAFGPPPKHMKVFWRGRSPWRDAKSRPATDDEILNVTRNALETWFA